MFVLKVNTRCVNSNNDFVWSVNRNFKRSSLLLLEGLHCLNMMEKVVHVIIKGRFSDNRHIVKSA